MKYLIIAALASIVFLLIYARIRPYLKLIQKVAQSLNSVSDVRATTPAQHKLVRCDGCGTWVPADRALSLNSGLATFCSPECRSKRLQKIKTG